MQSMSDFLHFTVLVDSLEETLLKQFRAVDVFILENVAQKFPWSGTAQFERH